MRLSGDFTLDDNSIRKLKDIIKDDVMNEISDRKCDFEEVKNYLRKCSYPGYLSIIKDTINEAMKHAPCVQSINWKTNMKEYEQLIKIKQILDS